MSNSVAVFVIQDGLTEKEAFWKTAELHIKLDKEIELRDKLFLRFLTTKKFVERAEYYVLKINIYLKTI